MTLFWFFSGIAIGYVLGNKRARRGLGKAVSWLGEYLQKCSRESPEDRGNWVQPVKGREIEPPR